MKNQKKSPSSSYFPSSSLSSYSSSKNTLILDVYFYLLARPKGVFTKDIQAVFFPNKDDRTFIRFKKMLKDYPSPDGTGKPLFQFEMINKKQLIKLATTAQAQEKKSENDIMEFHLIGLLFADAMISNIKRRDRNSDNNPEMRQTILDLINVAKEAISHPYTPSNKLKNLHLKFYSKKFGHKVYGSNDLNMKILDSVTHALYNELKIIVKYRNRNNKIKQIKVSPFTLLEHKGAFYILGPQGDSTQIKLLAIDRIVAIEKVTKENFQYPEDYSPKVLLSKGLGVGDYDLPLSKIKIKFSKKVSYLILERFWHSSQKIKKLENGSVILELVVPDSYELQAFVQSFGKEANVVSI